MKRFGWAADGVGDIGIVVAVAGRGLHDRGLLDAGLVHGGNQLLQRDRSRARPVGLVAAQRRQRVTRGVAGDDVRMDIDRGFMARSSALRGDGDQRDPGAVVFRKAIGGDRKVVMADRLRCMTYVPVVRRRTPLYSSAPADPPGERQCCFLLCLLPAISCDAPQLVFCGLSLALMRCDRSAPVRAGHVPIETRAHHRALRPRWYRRRDHAACGAESQSAFRPAVLHRKPAGCRRHRRHAGGPGGPGRRIHACHGRRRPHHREGAVQVLAL